MAWQPTRGFANLACLISGFKGSTFYVWVSMTRKGWGAVHVVVVVMFDGYLNGNIVNRSCSWLWEIGVNSGEVDGTSKVKVQNGMIAVAIWHSWWSSVYDVMARGSGGKVCMCSGRAANCDGSRMAREICELHGIAPTCRRPSRFANRETWPRNWGIVPNT